MTATDNVRIGMRRINIHRFTGTVIDSQRSSETSFTGHSNGQVVSSTTHYNEIFLRTPQGEERSIEVGNANVPVRTGNVVTVTLGIIGNREKGYYTSVLNHDTGTIGHKAKAINDLAGPTFYNMLIIVFVFVGVMGGALLLKGDSGAVLPLLATVGYFLWIFRRRKKLRTAMEASMRQAR